ncbi:dihydroxyacetone kinase phosphoryl donor subunit DhaM [Actinokineospora auranticolor]|uniref:Phosphocarrier protein HPr n=1 Tax=Actinokineospora auranticolor TaxID=155976 RepID=A0A2S6GG72_9PSEU|nr:dihydroxyacetone kinase phosphoryl donor subunit DhaM [Actinokineospora auranticolor]PPK64227.1 PTS hybrid protein [Actinokineospora auranticolor]
MTVGIVIVSHSAALAAGVVELAGQMAPDVVIIAAGGDGDGGLGTDFEAVSEAVERAQSGDGVVLLYDLGSAKMVADLAVEMLGDPESAAVVDAPLVEGAVAGAVAAQAGADLDGVLSAAASALADQTEVDSETAGVTLLLTNETGLHARPASQVVQAIAGLDAQVTVRFGDRSADGRSVLALMGLGAAAGDRITVGATGPDAREALTRLENLVRGEFR